MAHHHRFTFTRATYSAYLDQTLMLFRCCCGEPGLRVLDGRWEADGGTLRLVSGVAR